LFPDTAQGSYEPTNAGAALQLGSGRRLLRNGEEIKSTLDI